MKMETTRKRRIARLIAFVLPLMVIVFFGIGWAVYGLWNWLMPSIFGLHAITYWQAFGLMFLSWLLFGGLRGAGGSRGRWRHGMREHWEKMTPAEREEFVKGLRSRWAGTTPPEPEAKA
jgi:hypothetical protein